MVILVFNVHRPCASTLVSIKCSDVWFSKESSSYLLCFNSDFDRSSSILFLSIHKPMQICLTYLDEFTLYYKCIYCSKHEPIDDQNWPVAALLAKPAR